MHFEGQRQEAGFSVRRALAGKHVMLIGVTGFIGKVWLANTLMELPKIGRIYLLIRRQKSNPAQRRFEKIVEESPVFDPLFEKYGAGFGEYLRDKVEVVEGDVTQAGLGLEAETARRLQKSLDLIVNSSGLTDFNPIYGMPWLPIRMRPCTSWILFAEQITRDSCIFRHVMWRASGTDGLRRR